MLRIEFIGNVGSDAVVNSTESGKKIISFNVAVNKKWKDKAGVENQSTTWINCSIWREPGERCDIAQYFKSGTKLWIEGEPGVRVYEKKSGETAGSLNCNIQRFEFLGGGSKDEKVEDKPINKDDEKTSKPEVQSDTKNSDDLPF